MSTKSCSVCSTDLPKASFSKNQWQKGSAAKCKTCVADPPGERVSVVMQQKEEAKKKIAAEEATTAAAAAAAEAEKGRSYYYMSFMCIEIFFWGRHIFVFN
jgi:hypothetical protein